MKPVKVPMPWIWYITQPCDQRESWYQAWCTQQGLDPAAQATAEQWCDMIPVSTTAWSQWADAVGIGIPQAWRCTAPGEVTQADAEDLDLDLERDQE